MHLSRATLQSIGLYSKPSWFLDLSFVMKSLHDLQNFVTQPKAREQNEMLAALCDMGFPRNVETARALTDALRSERYRTRAELMDHVVARLASAAAAAETANIAPAVDH